VDLQVNQTDGSFVVSINGGDIVLRSGSIGFHANSIWYTSSGPSSPGEKRLMLSKLKPISGQDELGSFKGSSFTWMTQENPSAFTVQTNFKVYCNYVVFEQVYPLGASNTTLNDRNQVLTSFPSFVLPAPGNSSSSLKYMTYHDTFARPTIGLWDSDYMTAHYPGGMRGGSPLVLYSRNSQVVVSPLQNFIVGAQAVSKNYKNQLSCGLEGMITSIPQNFKHSTVMYVSMSPESTVTSTMYDWGSLLLKYYHKDRTTFTSDTLISMLSYWTDNGRMIFSIFIQSSFDIHSIFNISYFIFHKFENFEKFSLLI
jgi:hypothetical protein